MLSLTLWSVSLAGPVLKLSDEARTPSTILKKTETGILQGQNAAKLHRDIYGMNTEHPECSVECDPSWITDGWCDIACATVECKNDGGDCDSELFCAPDCLKTWLGDGFCDKDCMRPECQYDNGDCDGIYGRNDIELPPRLNSDFDFSKCPKECEAKRGDETCDIECDSKECNWDGLDCDHMCDIDCPSAFLGDGVCDTECNTERCAFDKGDCEECNEGCRSDMIGNGLCDGACMGKECQYDAGDCGNVCKSYRFPYKIFSGNDETGEEFAYPHCRKDWLGDGSCDCFCFNSDCDYDFGDCSPEEAKDCEKQILEVETYVKGLNFDEILIGGGYPVYPNQ
eukprot:GHVH01011552.1.p1 GENE.GHVH01011552.1~~GHVH01011552.1.p1  ORF type:complete len:340 (-),score=47.98 GHVH01011552.1:646-1665(-)